MGVTINQMPAPHEVDFTDRLQVELARRVGMSWRDLRRGAAMSLLRDRLFGTDLDALEPGQVDTLELIVQQPEWRMSELADALRVDPSTATRAVQRMVALGLAERQTSRDDGRVVMVSATPAGRQWHDRLLAKRRVIMGRLLGEFSPDERIVFAEMLERFVGALDELVDELAGSRHERAPQRNALSDHPPSGSSLGNAVRTAS